MEYQFCNKTFTTDSNLKQHQRKTKYCLKIQGVKPENIYICKYCDKQFNHKNVYYSHLISHENNEKFMKY